MTKGYSEPDTLTLKGEDIKELEVDCRDSVRITLNNGAYILISPKLRDIHDPDGDMHIERFAEGVDSIDRP
jgi:hypothetical protein